ncbi:MAG: aldehyde oxidase [Proteobacteria bacterium]|nr:MAG: aldehyde oxidase [Pseudomonadota bacterium]
MKEYDAFKVVNKSPRRVDALKLATGQGTFTDDEVLPGTLHVKMLWSPHAHARIASIDVSEAEAMPGVHCVLYHGNVPRVAHTTAGQGFPEPSPWDAYMFDTKVRFVGDRVAAVAAETEVQALKALERIKVEYEVLPKPEQNIACKLAASVGDVEAGFAASDIVLERTYDVGYAQQAPIEPHVAITHLDEDDRLVVRVATQVPFHSRRILAQVLEIPVARVRVLKPRIGGGFGVKQEILVEDVPALVTLRTGRPARWAYTRSEELVSARTRHAQTLTMKLGAKRDGTLVALSMNVLGNSGAYGAHALTVVSCTGGKALPLYRAEHYHFDATVMYTNLPVGGAFRGYGAPQGFYAVEILMDELAHELGMDPVALRRKNMIRSGDDNPLAVALGEGGEGFPQRIRSCGLDACITQGMEAIGWERRATFDKTGTKRRGMGMVALMQGSGIPGVDMAASFLKLNDDGSFNLLAGATDIGTGSDTVLSQIAAEELGVSVDDIIIYTADTDLTPFDTGAYASSTTYISGMSVKKAAAAVKQQIISAAAKIWGVPEDGLVAKDKAVHRPDGETLSYGDVCRSTLYHVNQHQIMDHASHLSFECPPPFAAHFCEVEVDVETGEIEVLKYVAAVDCGVAIHPKGAEGQTEGGVQMGLGWALTERYLFDEGGRMVNDTFGGYKIFGALDMPQMTTLLVPTYEPSGPFGAKSVSEIPINGPAPLLSNAIFDAIGVRFRQNPITPEMVWRALREQQ